MKHERSEELNQALALLEKATVNPETKADQKEETKPIDYKQVVEKEFEQLQATIEALENQNLENVARIQTMARRHGEEDLQLRKYGGAKLAEDILKPIDLLKKVLAIPVENEEVKNYFRGFEMIVKQLEKALIDNGIQMIEIKVGDEFDPSLHNANEQIETTAVKSGQIAEVIANGYKMYDRVIIHALVKVAK